MKRILLTTIIIAIISGVFAQKKEELVQRITQLESSAISLQKEIKDLQDENTQMQSTIDNLKASIKVVTDANELLENRIKFQEDLNKSQAETIGQMLKELTELKQLKAATDPNALITDPKTEEDSIISVVQQFYGAKKWEDLLPIVYNPNKVEPLMRKKYANGYNRRVIDKNTIAIPGSNYKPGDKFIVNVRNDRGSALPQLYMRKTMDGFKVDWEASAQYNAEELNSYTARHGIEKILIRVSFDRQDNAYYDNYGLGDNYYFLYSSGESYLYYLKNSPIGQRITELLKGSDKVNLIIEVQGKMKTNNYGENKYFAFVTRIVQEDWFSK